MAVTAQAPDGATWKVRRSVLHGRDGRGRRWRWRGPSGGWLDALELARVAELGEVPVVGVVFVVFGALVVVVLLAVFLPFLALGLLEALVLGLLLTGGAAAATLFGRPLVVRAERPGDAPEVRAWAVKGWGRSRQVRDQVVEALRAGVEPTLGDEARPF